MSLYKAEKDFLIELSENDQYISWLITLVAEDLGLPDWIMDCSQDQLDQLFTQTIALINRMLKTKKVRIGDLTHNGFREWSLSPEAAVERIARSWAQIGRVPLPTEHVAWFSLPDSVGKNKTRRPFLYSPNNPVIHVMALAQYLHGGAPLYGR